MLARQLFSILLVLAVIFACGTAIAADAGPTADTPDPKITDSNAKPAKAAPEEGSGEPPPAGGEAKTPAEQVEDDPLGSAAAFVNAIRKGNWRMAAALALALLMFGLSKAKIREKLKIFDGDRGGAILVMVLALAGAGSTTLATGAPLDWKLAVTVIGIAWTAVGGYTWIKQMIKPRDKNPKPEIPKAQVVS